MDEPVLTPNGFVLTRDLKQGDALINPNGTTQTILKLHSLEEHDYFEVTFDDRTSVTCSSGHLWKAKSTRPWRGGINKDWHLYDARSIYNLYQEWELNYKEKGWSPALMIPLPEALEFPEQKYGVVDPYLLGVLLGDGCVRPKDDEHNQVTITTSSLHVLHRINELTGLDTSYFYAKDGGSCYCMRFAGQQAKSVASELRNVGVYGKLTGDKFIPETYKFGSTWQRTKLLQGLMDSDGYVDSRGHLSYSTISKQLAEDVAFVIRSLGGKATISDTKKPKGPRRKQCYTIFFDIANSSRYVTRPDRACRCKDKANIGNSGCACKVIRSIKPIGRRQSRCITVSNPNGLYITGNGLNVTHNSFLGCMWLILCAFKYPGSSWLIARMDFTALTKTVLVTFNEVLRMLPKYYQDQVVYKAGIENTAHFANGSKIFFMHIKYKPADPEYNYLGSLALSGSYIDECQEIEAKAISVLRGRYSQLMGKNADGTEWHIKPKSLYCCNPVRNWVYNDFVKPDMEGTLEPYRKFVKALPADNPYVPQEYLDNLMRADKATVMRLVYGRFDYEEGEDLLFDQEAVNDVFTNKILPMGKRMISADIATKGHDRFILYEWTGNVAKLAEDRKYTPGKEVEMDVRRHMRSHRVETRYTIVDADGVGNFLSSYIPGIKEFHGGGKPSDPKYKNLRSECYFKLAELVNKRAIRIECTEEQAKRIKEEMMVVKQVRIDNDEQKKQIIPKEEMKKALGRSPDSLDGLMMNMWFRKSCLRPGPKAKVLKHNKLFGNV